MKRVPKEDSSRGGRRRYIRWVANTLIVAGVLAVPFYFLGSCGYTWLQQRDLRQEIGQRSSFLTADVSLLFEQGAALQGLPLGNETTGSTALGSASTTGDAGVRDGQVEGETPGATGGDLEMRKLAELAQFRDAAEAFDRSARAGEAIGRIVIPAIDVDVIMVEGTGKSELKEGPGHWPETPFPGAGGNFVVSGHRTTYGAPFLHLDDLEPGDDIYVVLPYALVHYQVTDVFVVYPNQVETVAQRGKEQISLAACHPLYSARQRIVAQGDMVGFVLLK